MIWVRGEIVPDDALSISVLDRTFEHGLGLFETLRTWGGRPTLLGMHLHRLVRSARELGLAIDESALPGPEDVARLREAEGVSGDVTLRITLSGGPDAGTPGALWMRIRPLPPPIPGPGARVRSTWRIPEGDRLARYKTLNYWARRIAFEEADRDGFHEDLGRAADGRVLEGSRTNLFVVRDGALLTPAASDGAPILPGIMRSVVIGFARGVGYWVEERPGGLPIEEVEAADEVFLTNGGRGIIPVAQLGPHREDEPGRVRRFDAPGRWTNILKAKLDVFLYLGVPR